MKLIACGLVVLWTIIVWWLFGVDFGRNAETGFCLITSTYFVVMIYFSPSWNK